MSTPAVLGFFVQCAVCPQQALVDGQPGGEWLCPRCAEVAEPAGTFRSGLILSQLKVDGVAVEGREFGPHDIIAHLDRSEIGSWVVFCNCGEQFAGDEDTAHRLHRGHRVREIAKALADDDEYPVGEVQG